MRTMFSALASALLLAVGLAAPGSAQAIVNDVWFMNSPADACQLGIPTTDTRVRPKATGFRNEGTTNQYVICGFGNGIFSGTSKGMWSAALNVTSMDGGYHSMTCTFVTTNSSWGIPVVGNYAYFTKTLNSIGSSGTDAFYLDATDFGGALGDPIYNAGLSITCILPPQVAITFLQTKQFIVTGN